MTADGCEVITRFPAEDLLIAGKPYYTVGGSLPLEREVTSERNTIFSNDDTQEAIPAGIRGHRWRWVSNRSSTRPGSRALGKFR